MIKTCLACERYISTDTENDDFGEAMDTHLTYDFQGHKYHKNIPHHFYTNPWFPPILFIHIVSTLYMCKVLVTFV